MTEKLGVNFLVDKIKTVPPEKVLMYSVLGMLAGAGFVVVNHALSDDIEGNLSPAAPYMKQLAPDIHGVFLRYMGSFYRLCPEAKQKEYKKHVRRAIRLSNVL